MLGSRRSGRGRTVWLAAGQEEADRTAQSPLNVGTTGFDKTGATMKPILAIATLALVTLVLKTRPGNLLVTLRVLTAAR